MYLPHLEKTITRYFVQTVFTYEVTPSLSESEYLESWSSLVDSPQPDFLLHLPYPPVTSNPDDWYRDYRFVGLKVVEGKR